MSSQLTPQSNDIYFFIVRTCQARKFFHLSWVRTWKEGIAAFFVANLWHNFSLKIRSKAEATLFPNSDSVPRLKAKKLNPFRQLAALVDIGEILSTSSGKCGKSSCFSLTNYDGYTIVIECALQNG